MQRRIHGTELNFDEWRQLAQSDPQAFERRRAQVLEAFIEEAPPANRDHLRRLQWRIDMERRYRWRHPLIAAQRLYAMMMESAVGEGGLLSALQGLMDATAPHAGAGSKVVSLRDAKPR